MCPVTREDAAGRRHVDGAAQHRAIRRCCVCGTGRRPVRLYLSREAAVPGEPFVAEPPPAPDPLVRRAPSGLLAARYGVVPFHGRDDDLAQLRDWRETPGAGGSVAAA